MVGGGRVSRLRVTGTVDVSLPLNDSTTLHLSSGPLESIDDHRFVAAMLRGFAELLDEPAIVDG
jgi:hypothetical protein